MFDANTAFRSNTQVLGLAKPLEQYEFVTDPLTWEVDPFNNGTMVNLTGTVQEVYAQIIKINPDFKLNVPDHKLEDDVPNDDPTGSSDTPYALCYHTLHNTYGWNSADESRIKEGISYLRGVPGQPHASPGHGQCSRVSCSYNAAIYWCSDHADAFSLPSFGVIADCAEIARANCVYRDYLERLMVLGQHFVSSC